MRRSRGRWRRCTWRRERRRRGGRPRRRLRPLLLRRRRPLLPREAEEEEGAAGADRGLRGADGAAGLPRRRGEAGEEACSPSSGGLLVAAAGEERATISRRLRLPRAGAEAETPRRRLEILKRSDFFYKFLAFSRTPSPTILTDLPPSSSSFGPAALHYSYPILSSLRTRHAPTPQKQYKETRRRTIPKFIFLF